MRNIQHRDESKSTQKRRRLLSEWTPMQCVQLFYCVWCSLPLLLYFFLLPSFFLFFHVRRSFFPTDGMRATAANTRDINNRRMWVVSSFVCSQVEFFFLFFALYSLKKLVKCNKQRRRYSFKWPGKSPVVRNISHISPHLLLFCHSPKTKKNCNKAALAGLN